MTIRHFAKATFCLLLTAFFVLSNPSRSHAQEQGLIQITNSAGETAIGPSWSQGNAISFITNRGSSNGRMNDVWSVAPDGSNVTRLTVFPEDSWGGDVGVSEALWLASTGDLVVHDSNVIHEWLRFQLSQNPPLPVSRTVYDGPSPYFEELLVVPGGLGSDSFAVSQDGKSAGWGARTTSNGVCPLVTNAVVSPFDVLDGQYTNGVGSVLASGVLNCGVQLSDALVGVSYSPDAAQFVLARVPDPHYYGFDLEIYNASGGLVRKLTNNGGGPNPVINWNPSWSPDGSRIAFASNSSGQFQIYTINADGSNLAPVTAGGGDWPTWSPDSSTIAFESTRGGNSEIYSVPSVVSSPPGNLSATVGNQSVILYWNVPPSIPQGYNIYADQVVDGVPVPLGLVNSSGPVQGTHFVVIYLPKLNMPPVNGQIYRFGVTAVYPTGESSPALIFAQPGGFTAPPHPLHPILFLHGIDANAANTWQTTADFLSNTLHWTCGGTMSYRTDDNPVEGDKPLLNDLSFPTPTECGPNRPFLKSSDYFTANFGEPFADYPQDQDISHQGISHQGDEVGGFVNELHGIGKLSVVAHSMGGLAARSYLQASGLFSPDQITDFVTLGTPHYGVDQTTLEWLGATPLGELIKEVWPDKAIALASIGLSDMDGSCVANGDSSDLTTLSPFLQKLDNNPSNALPSDIRYVVVSGSGVKGYLGTSYDRCSPLNSLLTDLVVPTTSSTLAPIPSPPQWTPKYTQKLHTDLPSDFAVILCALDPHCTEYQALSSSGNAPATGSSGGASLPPVDIQVTAPNGNAISNGFTSMPGAEYSTVTDPTGHEIASVVIPFPQGGQYTVTATPKPGAQPTDTFTILQIQGGVTTTIAQDMPIQNIPPAGFQTMVSNGTSFMVLSPTSIAFGNVALNRKAERVLTLENGSATKAEIGPVSLTVTAGNPGDFSFRRWCRPPVEAGKRCTIAVHFTPTAVGKEAATLNIVTNASDIPLEVPITAAGVKR